MLREMRHTVDRALGFHVQDPPDELSAVYHRACGYIQNHVSFQDSPYIFSAHPFYRWQVGN